MEQLFQFSASRISSVKGTFKRYLWHTINWNNRLIAITGARGVGKTTFLLQYIKENLSEKPDEVHKYKDWSREIKNVYDYFSDL